MKIKICGLTRPCDVAAVNEAQPDFAGFVFAAGKRRLDEAAARRLRARLSETIVPAGVFADAPFAKIARLFDARVIGIAQLHGGETPEDIAALRDAGIPVIKAVTARELTVRGVSECAARYAAARYLLFDSGAGSGAVFDWAVLTGVDIATPWFLAGGITLDNLDAACARQPFGIDVSSGVETNGVKDREKILALTRRVRAKNTTCTSCKLSI